MSDEKKKDSKVIKPKSWIERLAERAGYMKKIGEVKRSFEETKLGDTSVSILQDQKLAERIQVLDILMFAMNKAIPDDVPPKARVKILKDRLDLLDQAIQMIAAPYARAGNYPRYSKLLHGWNVTYSVGSSWITRVGMYFTANDVDPKNINLKNNLNDDNSRSLSDNSIVVYDLQLALIQHIFPDAKDVLGYCFKDEDVAVKAVTVVQNMMPQQGFGSGMNINRETENM